MFFFSFSSYFYKYFNKFGKSLKIDLPVKKSQKVKYPKIRLDTIIPP